MNSVNNQIGASDFSTIEVSNNKATSIVRTFFPFDHLIHNILKSDYAFGGIYLNSISYINVHRQVFYLLDNIRY